METAIEPYIDPRDRTAYLLIHTYNDFPSEGGKIWLTGLSLNYPRWRVRMRILIMLFMVALPIASAAADQYRIVPYGTSKPEGSQLETVWRAAVINESRPGLAYCEAITKLSAGDSVVSVKCRAQKLTGGSPPVGEVVPHGISNSLFETGGAPPWWGIDQSGALSFCQRNAKPLNTFSCASALIPTEP